jgi:protein KTI12
LIKPDANTEKTTRAKIKSEVQRNLVGDTVVVVDSLNYIKGFRYEMYCLAREEKTTYCLVYCNTDPAKCAEFNAKNANSFDPKL